MVIEYDNSTLSCPVKSSTTAIMLCLISRCLRSGSFRKYASSESFRKMLMSRTIWLEGVSDAFCDVLTRNALHRSSACGALKLDCPRIRQEADEGGLLQTRPTHVQAEQPLLGSSS